MISYFGDFAEDDTVLIPFNTFSSDDPSASVTITNLADADIKVHKDGGATQISTDGATIAIDFDSITGNHLVTIDTSVHADYSTGSEYAVRIEGTTVDGATINAWIGAFSIERAGGVLALLKGTNSLANIEDKIDTAQTDLDTITGSDGATLATAQGLYAPSKAGDSMDISSVSGDSVAADNLEAMYDGNGYTDQTAPSSRSQVEGIGAASGGSLNFANEADNVDSAIKSISFDGVETSGTNTSVNAEAGTYHQIDDTANNIDIVYQFDIGGGRTAVELIWKGRLVGTNDVMVIKVYNGSTWDTLKNVNGHSNSAPTDSDDNSTENVPLLSTHTGTGSDLGKVFVRLECISQSNPTIYTDQLLIEAVNIGQSIGYSGGQIWVDTVDGTAGTEVFVNGTADNAVLTWADALTLSTALGVTDFHIINGSTITLTGNSDNYSLFGDNWTLDLNGQSVDEGHFQGAAVSGIATGTHISFLGGEMGAVTLGADFHLHLVALQGTITLPAAEVELFVCHHHSATAPILDFGAAVGNTTVHMHNYAGGIEVQNMGQNGTDVLHLDGNGKLIINANCTGGTINLRGHWEIADSGSVTIVLDDITTDVDSVLVDTAVIGALGAGLSNIPWNSSWDAEVQSEVDDALVVQKLDHLVAVAESDDPVDNSIMSKLADSGATADWSAFVNTTDSLRAIRDNMALASVLGALADAAVTGDPTVGDTLMQYLKQLVNLLAGSAGIGTMPASQAPANGINLFEMVRAIYDDTNSLEGTKIPDTLSLANINAGVDTALTTTTYAEPTQDAPGATLSIEAKIAFLYKAWRNRSDQTSTTYQLYNDGGLTVDHKATVSDDGTTAVKGEVATGP